MTNAVISAKTGSCIFSRYSVSKDKRQKAAFKMRQKSNFIRPINKGFQLYRTGW